MNKIKIYLYTTEAGKSPFNEWLRELDQKTRARIRARIDRVELGNLGDCKRIISGDGVWEIRIDFGGGYRVYFGRKGSVVIILLLGGGKGSQRRDISRAIKYWHGAKGLFYE